MCETTAAYKYMVKHFGIVSSEPDMRLAPKCDLLYNGCYKRSLIAGSELKNRTHCNQPTRLGHWIVHANRKKKITIRIHILLCVCVCAEWKRRIQAKNKHKTKYPFQPRVRTSFGGTYIYNSIFYYYIVVITVPQHACVCSLDILVCILHRLND